MNNISIKLDIRQRASEYENKPVFSCEREFGDEMTAKQMRARTRELMNGLKDQFNEWIENRIDEEQLAADKAAEEKEQA